LFQVDDFYFPHCISSFARVSDWPDVQGELLGKKKPAESGRVEGRVCSKEENMNSQQDWTTASD